MIFKKPEFWDNKNISLLSILLLPFTLILALSNFIENFSKKKNYKIKTVCVGNIYVGGTGKTPLAIEIYKIFESFNIKAVFVKKFYKSQADEIKLLKKNGKLISKKNRQLSIDEAENKKFDIVVLDDGLQDKSINYDLKIVCFNKNTFLGNGQLMPAGPLRENINSLKKYDVVFLNGESIKKSTIIQEIKSQKKEIKIFETVYQPVNINKINKKIKYIIFSGIGNPKNFKFLLEKHNFKIVKSIEYPDHYNYSKKDIVKIKKVAKNFNAKILTTEKDYLRIDRSDRQNINLVKIKLKIQKKKEFTKFLKKFYENN
jgi:tetraacyldisaccharide 4'-kinase